MNHKNEKKRNQKICFCILVSLIMFSVIGGFHTSEMKVNSQQKTLRLIPSGQAVGMKLKTRGVMVVGVEAKGHLPAKKAGVKNGDIILRVNEVSVLNTRHFEEILKTIGGETVTLTVLRGEEEKALSLTPILNQSNQYVCGMWLRDSAAGIGTVTFFSEDKQHFAALGHPINDMDTDKTYSVRTGQLEIVEVKGAKPGEKNCPGELVGVLSGTPVGTIASNDSKGLFGAVTNGDFIKNKAVPLCPKNEIQIGKATILSTVSEEGTREYEIEIVKVLDTKDNKDFIIKVTDETLLQNTGGIVQGMSGSPILQNGKIVGAVTHVMVQDPAKGFGISVEKMIPEN